MAKNRIHTGGSLHASHVRLPILKFPADVVLDDKPVQL